MGRQLEAFVRCTPQYSKFVHTHTHTRVRCSEITTNASCVTFRSGSQLDPKERRGNIEATLMCLKHL